MEKTRLEMILFFTIFLFLFIFPFQLAVAQGVPPTTTTGMTPGKTAEPTPGNTPGNSTKVGPRCLKSEFKPITVPLKQIRNSLNGGANVTIEGTVSIVDSCNFEVSGFTYFAAATNTYWFGSDSIDSTALNLVCDIPIGQFQLKTVTFTLKSNITFIDFNVLNLYSIDEGVTFAQAELRTIPKPSNTNTDTDPISTGKTNQSNRLLFNLFMMTEITVGVLVLIWTM